MNSLLLIILLIFICFEIIRVRLEYLNRKYSPDLIPPGLTKDKELSSVLKYDSRGHKL